MDLQFERQTSIDNMIDSLYEAMTSNGLNGLIPEAASVYEEWVVDGVDPQEVEKYEFTFLKNFTLPNYEEFISWNPRIIK